MVLSASEVFTYYISVLQLGCFSTYADILELVCTYPFLEAGASASNVRGILHLRYTYLLYSLLSYCPMHYLGALIPQVEWLSIARMYRMPHVVVFVTDAARAPEVALLLSQISGLSRVSHYLAPHSASSTKGHSHACEVLSVN